MKPSCWEKGVVPHWPSFPRDWRKGRVESKAARMKSMSEGLAKRTENMAMDAGMMYELS